MPTWLLKTEPSEFAFGTLVKNRRATWDGVENAQALIHLRQIRSGDSLLIYHTGDEKAIVGLAKALGDAFADPRRPAALPDGSPKFAVVDLAPVRAAHTPMTLAAIKADARFADFALVKQSRLSVVPVPPALDKIIRAATGLAAG